jgi:hypothetical protein
VSLWPIEISWSSSGEISADLNSGLSFITSLVSLRLKINGGGVSFAGLVVVVSGDVVVSGKVVVRISVVGSSVVDFSVVVISVVVGSSVVVVVVVVVVIFFFVVGFFQAIRGPANFIDGQNKKFDICVRFFFSNILKFKNIFCFHVTLEMLEGESDDHKGDLLI